MTTSNLINIKEGSKIEIKNNGEYNLELEKEENIIINVEKDVNAVLKIINNNNEVNIRINIEENSVFNCYSINSGDTLNLTIDQDENTTSEVYNFFTNKNSFSSAEINLNKVNSKVNYNVGVYNQSNEKSKHKMRVNHFINNTDSNITNRIIVGNNSTSDFEVESYIDKKAYKSKAYQSTRAITLSDDANVKMKPVLLIDNYDVMGGHAASSSKIDDKDLYYLQSRGINKSEAIKLVTLGFILENVPELVKEDIKEIIERKMQNE